MDYSKIAKENKTTVTKVKKIYQSKQLDMVSAKKAAAAVKNQLEMERSGDIITLEGLLYLSSKDILKWGNPIGSSKGRRLIVIDAKGMLRDDIQLWGKKGLAEIKPLHNLTLVLKKSEFNRRDGTVSVNWDITEVSSVDKVPITKALERLDKAAVKVTDIDITAVMDGDLPKLTKANNPICECYYKHILVKTPISRFREASNFLADKTRLDLEFSEPHAKAEHGIEFRCSVNSTRHEIGTKDKSLELVLTANFKENFWGRNVFMLEDGISDFKIARSDENGMDWLSGFIDANDQYYMLIEPTYLNSKDENVYYLSGNGRALIQDYKDIEFVHITEGEASSKCDIEKVAEKIVSEAGVLKELEYHELGLFEKYDDDQVDMIMSHIEDMAQAVKEDDKHEDDDEGTEAQEAEEEKEAENDGVVDY